MINYPVKDKFFQLPYQLRRSVTVLAFLAFIALPVLANDDVQVTSDDAKSLVM